MEALFLVPKWFFGYDAIFQLFFAVITLIVSMYSFKVYRLSNQNQSKLFGISFLFFSIAYFIQSTLNYLILTNSFNVERVELFSVLGIYVHMFFFLIGLVTLAYMTLRTKDSKTYLVILLSFLVTFFVIGNKISWFYVTSSLLLIFISMYYFFNFTKNKKPGTLMVFLAFLFLLFGHIHFIFSVNHTLYYAIGHFLELLAYILILINLLWVLKNGKKKK